jgi:lipopolysaccharide biosynthesis glycosyltransferase
MSAENLSSEDAIVVVCCVDDNYAMPLGVLIQSIGANLKRGRRVTLYVLYESLHRTSMADIAAIIRQLNNVSIVWKKINSDCFKNGRVSAWITKAAYYRILMPFALPLTVTKAIYLDCDIVVQVDISDLWETAIDDYWVAGVLDMNILKISAELEEIISDKSCRGGGYFNSGVILANIKKWREFNVAQKAIDFLRKYNEKITWHDQDVLNVICAGHWLSLAPNWNQQTPWLKNLPKEAIFQGMMSKPSVIHFSSEQKPWHYGNRHPLRSFFFYYLEQTPWRNFRSRRKIAFGSICRKIVKRLLP